MLNILPEKIYDVKNENVIDTDLISMDENIIRVLRVVTNG
jgi:hypothetical protein